MRQWPISIPSVFSFIGLASFALFASGESPIAVFQPFTVTIQKQQPVSLSISVPIDNKIVTATVPLTLSVNLEVEVSGEDGISVLVLDAEPITTTMKSLPDRDDALGNQFSIQSPDEIKIVEWTAYAKSGRLSIVGKVINESQDRRFSLVDFSFRFYNEDGELINAASASAGGRWVEPGESLPLDFKDLAELDSFAKYEVIVDASWTDVQ